MIGLELFVRMQRSPPFELLGEGQLPALKNVALFCHGFELLFQVSDLRLVICIDLTADTFTQSSRNGPETARALNSCDIPRQGSAELLHIQ